MKKYSRFKRNQIEKNYINVKKNVRMRLAKKVRVVYALSGDVSEILMSSFLFMLVVVGHKKLLWL